MANIVGNASFFSMLRMLDLGAVDHELPDDEYNDRYQGAYDQPNYLVVGIQILTQLGDLVVPLF